LLIILVFFSGFIQFQFCVNCASLGEDELNGLSIIGNVSIEKESEFDPYSDESAGFSLKTEVGAVASFIIENGASILLFPESRISIYPSSNKLQVDSGQIAIISDEKVSSVTINQIRINDFRGIVIIKVDEGKLQLSILDGEGFCGSDNKEKLYKGNFILLNEKGEVIEKRSLGKERLRGLLHKTEVYLAKTKLEIGPLAGFEDYQPPILEEESCVEVCPLE